MLTLRNPLVVPHLLSLPNLVSTPPFSSEGPTSLESSCNTLLERLLLLSSTLLVILCCFVYTRYSNYFKSVWETLTFLLHCNLFTHSKLLISSTYDLETCIYSLLSWNSSSRHSLMTSFPSCYYYFVQYFLHLSKQWQITKCYTQLVLLEILPNSHCVSLLTTVAFKWIPLHCH